jgi:hypothetical protein
MYIHPSPLAEVSLRHLIAGQLSGKKSLLGAEPGIELGPALQQADALPSELSRTLSELLRTLLSYVAP